MTRRQEFSKQTKRAAIKRSNGLCEATGAAYGFPRGHRCNADLRFGAEFDHYPVRAVDGGSSDLSNCVAVCVRCHRWKTGKVDTPQIAKSKRLWDKKWNIRDRSTSTVQGANRPVRRKLNGTVVPR